MTQYLEERRSFLGVVSTAVLAVTCWRGRSSGRAAAATAPARSDRRERCRQVLCY